MKFSENWLREWVNPNIDTATLSEQLTMAGLEVDSVEPAAPAFNNVVVGQVVALIKHPEADKLNVCQVNVGQSENLTIVCGATNVAEGVKVPTAVIGAVLPGDFKIKKAKLRGQESCGMLCSAKELGLAESSDGLLILPNDAPVGQDVRDYFQLDDQIIEVDFTPNRGDCLSLAGIAREVSVLNNIDQTPLVIKPVETQIDDVFPIEVQTSNDCPRYLGRVIKNINPSASTPLWMKERLRRAGLRSLSPTVDVTNYVLLELGQPMHAFDLDKLSEKIVVRRASTKEKLKLLDESEIEMDEDVLVIADAKQSLAFAGVMGGLDSSVTSDTNHIFLECAFFNPDTIRGKARKFGMQTDSSYRFERGVDYHLQHRAMERATQLILEIAGGQAGPVTEAVSEEHLPKREQITMRSRRLNRLLGFSVEDRVIESYLTHLGMEWKVTGEGWDIVAPSYRFDIAIEADLIEEVGRIYGYNNLPTTTPSTEMKFVAEPEHQVSTRKIRSHFVSRGYQEAISYSFVDPQIQALLDPDTAVVELANPISAEMSVMRTTLWSSLLKAVQHNHARQQSRVRLFEIGKRFTLDDADYRQETVISGLISGDIIPTQWGESSRKVDFFDLKADVEGLLALSKNTTSFQFEIGSHPALHPGQCARICRNNNKIGYLGALHPEILQKLSLNTPVFLFELSYTEILNGLIPQYRHISKFPAIKRDLALVVSENVEAGTVFAEVKKAGDNRLQHVEIFDIYRGKGVAEGYKSLALALTIQDDAQTLTDEEVDKIIQNILGSLQNAIGATLRE